jgi:hypothetical protein
MRKTEEYAPSLGLPNELAIAKLAVRTETQRMAHCGAVTADGTRCRRRVKKAGDRCYQHRSGSAPWLRPATSKRSPRVRSQRGSGRAPIASQAPSSPPPRRVHEHERVREAAVFCADSLSGNWEKAVSDRITGYAQTSWQRLSRSRRKRNCKALARIARSILEAKSQIHTTVGTLFGWAAGTLGASGAARAFTEELASSIPLPIDPKMIAVARGIQVAGTLLCVRDNRDLTKCECFIDLALAETKERVNQILVAAMSDWTSLARFRPQAAGFA